MAIQDLSIIDRFLNTFVQYIDSGFGLLSGDVAHLTAYLIGIDITLVGLMWALDSQSDVFARLIKKVLYIGVFAFILNNFSTLADIIFQSFAGLGLNATNNGMTAADLLRPGKVASTGFDAAWPLMQQANDMMGFTSFFNHIGPIFALLIAWLIVIVSFFILAVQMFITVVEFKLTSLAGFILVPFALWNKSSFLAERVLGNVISSGIKVMVLAVIVGIGASFFSDFTTALNGQEPNFSQAMSLMLAAITLFGIGIFGPAIASGLVTGAPQLGAGAAVGTAGGLVAGGALIAGGAAAAGRMALGGIRAGTSLVAGAASAYRLGSAASGSTGMAGVGAGVAGMAQAGAGAVGQRLLTAAKSVSGGAASDINSGTQGAWKATGGSPPRNSGSPNGSSSPPPPPDWAQQLRSEQRNSRLAHTTAQAVKDGDRGGGAANPDLSEEK